MAKELLKGLLILSVGFGCPVLMIIGTSTWARGDDSMDKQWIESCGDSIVEECRKRGMIR